VLSAAVLVLVLVLELREPKPSHKRFAIESVGTGKLSFHPLSLYVVIRARAPQRSKNFTHLEAFREGARGAVAIENHSGKKT
jgi:hypothetical protein